MLDFKLIDRLSDLCGMSSSYLDWAGEPVTVNSENKIPLLKAMGFDLSSNSALETALESCMEQKWLSVLAPVVVVHQEKSFHIELKLPEGKRPAVLGLEITLENGDTILHKACLTGLQPKAKQTIRQQEYIALPLSVPEYLPLGYHSLKVTNNDFKAETRLIVVPSVCFEPDEMKAGKKIWGSGIQLYSVRSERNWGMGDLTDLRNLASGLGDQGADFIGLNPVHALYPDNPLHCSPYSPSSRQFDNVLYIDPEQAAEFTRCDKARTLLAQPETREKLQKLRNADYIAYDDVALLKLEVLNALFDSFAVNHLGKDTERARAFAKFCQERGEKLDQFALFETLFEHFRRQNPASWGWPCWPERYRSPESAAVKEFAQKNQQRITCFKYLQFLMDEQMAVAQTSAKSSGMQIGIYRDLAVGVDSSGADVWSDPGLYVLKASTGAPPDGLGPAGQDWGLPPFNPVTLQKRRYQPFVEMIRDNMRNCGALRIDHAMGLFRLWWCPNGHTENKGAKYGCYVHYPLQDMLGIIKLESHRQQCLVFGEDLGTVPREVTDSLPPARFYSSVMGIFEEEDGLFRLPADFKKKALAVLVCHDTPTLKGWWEEKDIDIAHSLGFFSDERAAADKDSREQTRKAVIKTLEAIGELPWGIDPDGHQSPDYSRELMERFSYYLALSASQITSFQLEDCMMIDTPVNVPGTSSEYSNWKRRLTENLEYFLSREDNRRFFKNLTGCRKA